MRFFRSERVSSLIQDELGKLMIREIEFPVGSLVTIASVDVDKKLERAKIGLSVIPASSAKAVLKMVNARAGQLQFELLKKINIKPMPRLIFEIDRGPEDAAEVEKVILQEQNNQGVSRNPGSRDIE